MADYYDWLIKTMESEQKQFLEDDKEHQKNMAAMKKDYDWLRATNLKFFNDVNKMFERKGL